MWVARDGRQAATGRRWLAVAACVGVGALGAAACGSDSGGSSSSAASGTSSGAAASTAVAKVPDSALVQAGQIQFCSDISTPPLESYGPGHKPEGSDIDIGTEIAKRLGLKVVWKNTAFAGIIPALTSRNCDAVLSQLFDKPERRKVVDFVDYMRSGQALLVPKGNPKGVQGLGDLCGMKVASETGTTIADLLRTQSKSCTAAGKPKVTVRLFLRDSDALQQLGLKQVDVYGTTTETVSFVSAKQPDTFAVAGKPFGEILCGIATRKGNTPLHDAIDKAFASMQADGTYKKILAKWNLGLDELKPGTAE
jgi:polar amino acid transport system substrate-binding protein